ncbi:hypothetical protein ES703_39307 [subsurface metagenome]
MSKDEKNRGKIDKEKNRIFFEGLLSRMTEAERNKVLHFDFDLDLFEHSTKGINAFFRLLCTYGRKYEMEIPEFFRQHHTAEDDAQRVFPEFKEYFPDLDPKKEEERMKQEEKEELFFIQDLFKIFAYGKLDEKEFRKMSPPQRDRLAEKYATEYQLAFVSLIFRRG